MTAPRSTDLMRSVDAWVARTYADERLCLHRASDACDPAEHLDLAAARTVVLHSAADEALRRAVWTRLVQLAQAEGLTGTSRWPLITVWMLLPQLGRGSRTIARSLRAELADVRSAMVMGLLAGLGTIDPDRQPDVRTVLIRHAFAAGWRVGRRPAAELPTEGMRLAQTVRPHGDADPGLGGTCDVIPVTWLSSDLAQRIQGERLGALAECLGLMGHVRAQRRRLRARRQQDRPSVRSAAGGTQEALDLRWGGAG
ncbi:hypothetical protein LVX13_04180 [Streptomyces albulus]|uniref:hypothetical protein n=1 Tax=Streptomyces noursei TaxID=1971 RepID=UPI001F2D3633|nr:hypothetical protein [Streptomyces noursei]MCE4942331.1 hypothetical protein [Streptomyces noursei]